MVNITVVGGTGYAGGNIVLASVQRGHHVVVYSRRAPSRPVAGVEYRGGDVADPGTIDSAVAGTDVLVSALSPRGQLSAAGAMRELVARMAEAVAARGVRLGVIGGAGSLLVAEGGPKLADTDEFPVEILPEAMEMDGVLHDLRGADPALDWFFVSPSAGFGPSNPGQATGEFRLGRDLLLSDASGRSFISGPDLGLAVVEEIEHPAHRRTRFTVGY